MLKISLSFAVLITCTTSFQSFQTYTGFPIGCFKRNESFILSTVEEPEQFLSGYKRDSYGLRARCHKLCLLNTRLKGHFTFFAVDNNIQLGKSYCHCLSDELPLLETYIENQYLCNSFCTEEMDEACEDTSTWTIGSYCPHGTYGTAQQCIYECSKACNVAPEPMPPVQLCTYDGSCVFGKVGSSDKTQKRRISPLDKYCKRLSPFSETSILPQRFELTLQHPGVLVLLKGMTIEVNGVIGSVRLHAYSYGSLTLIFFQKVQRGYQVVNKVDLTDIQVGVNVIDLKKIPPYTQIPVSTGYVVGFGFIGKVFLKLETSIWPKFTVLSYTTDVDKGAAEWEAYDGLWSDGLPETVEFQPQETLLAVSMELVYACTCAEHCASRKCNNVTGACFSCLPGWKGIVCEEPCENGTFGANCVHNCRHCYDNLCDRFTGKCSGSCPPGTHGTNCELCPDGSWGLDCKGKCGHCKNNRPCDARTGYCFNGCDSFFEPPLCGPQRECPAGRYGDQCQEECGFCVDGICDVYTGNCMCLEYFYGPTCSLPCGLCAGMEPCNPVTGLCEKSCVPFYTGEKCDVLAVCPPGYFGESCSRACGKCKGSVCDIKTGACANGCEDGYTPPFCFPFSAQALMRGQNQPCSPGYFGLGCTNVCGHCKFGKCDAGNGECNFGCDGPYMLPHCTTECDKNLYGENCFFECGHCLNETCSKENGVCTYGCKTNWGGPKCNAACQTKFGFMEFLSYLKFWEWGKSR